MECGFKKGRLLLWVVCLILLALMFPQESLAAEEEAEDISSYLLITEYEGLAGRGYLFDHNRRTGYLTSPKASLTLHHEKGIGSLYLTFNASYTPYYVVNLDTGEEKTIDNGYLHAFLDLVSIFGTAPQRVQLRFENGQAALYEMRVFTRGKVPDSIQKWSEPVEGKTDLVLFSAHSDDDQLFFAGLLPYYAVERGYQVQVVYLTSHWNTYSLCAHEVLDGLWAVGIRAYPVFAPYPDFFQANTLEAGFDLFEQAGHTREDMTGFVVEQLRRFRPMVAVGHDFDGEYGHIQHKIYAQLLADAVAVSGDGKAYPESASAYGVWDVPKTYIHLYKTNPIVIDYDQPLEAFNGKTAFQVTQDYGFPCHESQQGFMFTPWLYGSGCTKENKTITKVTQITKYNPAEFGLYRSTVGEDVQKNDFMENITSYAEQERLEQERLEAERLEQERLEQERLEQERLEAERLEQERLEAERLEAERLAAEQARQKLIKDITTAVIVLTVLLIALIGVLIVMRVQNIRRHKRRTQRRREKNIP